MAKQRYINTEFWIDEFIELLEPLDRYLFMYFLTNMYTNICGIYKLPMRQIMSDSKLKKSQIEASLGKFWGDTEAKQKILYVDGWVYIRNFERHQVARGSEKVKIGIEKMKKEVPKEVLEKIAELSKNPIGYLYHIGSKTELATLDSDSDLDSDLDKPTASVPLVEVPKKASRTPRPPQAHYELVEHFFSLKGWPMDQAIAHRYLRAATELLKACEGNKDLAKDKMLRIKNWAELKNLDWSIETVLKRWFETNEVTSTAPKQAYIDGDKAFQDERGDWWVTIHTGERRKYQGPLSAIQYA